MTILVSASGAAALHAPQACRASSRTQCTPFHCIIHGHVLLWADLCLLHRASRGQPASRAAAPRTLALCADRHRRRRTQGGDSAPSSRNLGPSSSKSSGAGKLLNVLLPLLLIIAAVLVNMYLVK